MQRLTALPLAGHVVLLPASLDHAAAQPMLASLLAGATGPETAGLFAPASPEGDSLVFSAPPGRVARFAELDAEGRELLRSEIGRLISELRRAAEAAARRDPARAGQLPALVAAATELPSFELVDMATPTPMNPLGAKGIGEAGTIGSTPAVHNAVIDAVSHLGVRHIDMPTTPMKIWRAIQQAQGGSN